jgi:beta-lactamase superfamily II metal-dependent hydrolase
MRSLSSLLEEKYTINFLSVGDADAIVIGYQEDKESPLRIALIDAGNEGDAKTIKDFIWNKYKTRRVDLAVCTHPDRDHKGGFFELMEDPDMEFGEFWCADPYSVLEDDDYEENMTEDDRLATCRIIYNHPTDSTKNLIDIAEKKCTNCFHVEEGDESEIMPIRVIGPSQSYYHSAAINLLNEFVELPVEADMGEYEDAAEVPDDENNSRINDTKDESNTNKCSLILLFTPNSSSRYLLCGDAAASSLQELVDSYGTEVKGCRLKVPHHGSIKNLTTRIIDELTPIASIISCAGNRHHPNGSIVEYLRKYGNVYTTSFNHNYGVTNMLTGTRVKPFREKKVKKTDY